MALLYTLRNAWVFLSNPYRTLVWSSWEKRDAAECGSQDDLLEALTMSAGNSFFVAPHVADLMIFLTRASMSTASVILPVARSSMA